MASISRMIWAFPLRLIQYRHERAECIEIEMTSMVLGRLEVELEKD